MDADVLQFGATNVFWRQIRNFVIDTTSVPASQAIAGVHWPTGQATSLQNLVFQLSSASGTQHTGLFIEGGSGGFVGALTFNGGLTGLTVGNQYVENRQWNSLLMWETNRLAGNSPCVT